MKRVNVGGVQFSSVQFSCVKKKKWVEEGAEASGRKGKAIMMAFAELASTGTETNDSPKTKPEMKTILVLTISFLAGYQLLHAFDPSGPFTVQIAAMANVTNDDIISRVNPFRAWSLLPTAAIAGAVYEIAGYRTALVFLSLAAGASTLLQAIAVLVRPGRAHALTLYQISMAAAAFSFSAGFTVNCSLFSLLPPAAYQAASSANSIAMMLGSLLSSFVGQGLVAILPAIGDLLWVTLAMVVLALLAVAAGVLSSALPAAERPLSGKEWASRVLEKLRFYHGQTQVLEWSFFSALVLATHTLVKTMWKSLFHDIDAKSGQVSNGVIYGATCGAAALCMFLMSAAPKATEASARFVLCIFPFAAAGTFAGMALSKGILLASILLVSYNALSECALVVASVMMGKAISEAERKKAEYDVERKRLLDLALSDDAPIPGSRRSAADAIASATASVSAALQRGATGLKEVPESSVSVNSVGEDRRIEAEVRAKKLVDFALVFTVNAVVSIAIQDIFNVVAIYGLHLTSRGWFWGFAVLSCILGFVVVITSVVHVCTRQKKSKGQSLI